MTTVSEVKYVDSKEHHPRADNLAVREQIKTSVVETMHSWLHMKMLDIEQSMEDADYLVILGDELSCLEGRTWKKKPKVIALLPHDSMRGKVEGFLSRRFDVFQTVAAPFGPRKLARVVAACEAGKIRNTTRPRSYLEPSPSRSSNVEAASTSLKANSDDDLLQIRGKRITNENGPPHTGLRTSPQPANTLEANHKQDPAADGPAINTKKPIHSVSLATNGVDNHRTKNDQYVDTESKPSIGKGRPRLLLVDDNKINLSLLETFVKKQKRSLHYDCAVNGLLALEAARKNTLGYDIIFMDVSMPGMDGLEATREIRKLERERVGAMGKAAAPPPALIVALTGLANGRDQADAFASGIDLFMTKPTKFKEIGSLIEKWCENESRRVEYR